jgi:hypothetical protein
MRTVAAQIAITAVMNTSIQLNPLAENKPRFCSDAPPALRLIDASSNLPTSSRQAELPGIITHGMRRSKRQVEAMEQAKQLVTLSIP